MAKQRILIVDDEEDICMILSYSLQKAGYEVLIAHSAEEALANYELKIKNYEVDLILLDIMMGEMSGLEMAEHLKRENHIPPIIFLTALSDESTILQGFKLGADDYISKPFRISEVLARVAAVLRRSANPKAIVQDGSEVLISPNSLNDYSQANVQNGSALVFEGIVVNKAAMSLKVDGEAVMTTRKEIELLCYLLTHRGQILSREHLLKNVWDSNGFVMERTVDVHITHLRRKLGQYGKRIVTKSGYGYMFSV
jgi:DNA-binding response OmpR family regulator